MDPEEFYTWSHQVHCPIWYIRGHKPQYKNHASTTMWQYWSTKMHHQKHEASSILLWIIPNSASNHVIMSTASLHVYTHKNKITDPLLSGKATAKTWSKNTYPHRYPEFLHWVTSNSLASQSHSISKATICTRKNRGPIASWHHYHTKLRFWSMICTFDHPKVNIKSYLMSMPTDCTIKMDPLLVALPQHKSLNSRQRF